MSLRPVNAAVAFLVTLGLLAGSSARADLLVHDSAFHFRVGYFGASFSTGSPNLDGGFHVFNNVDLEYEHFTDPTSSYTLRTILTYDGSTSRVRYSDIGVGRRFYIFSNGLRFEGTEGGNRIVQTPRQRFYIGGDAGLAQAAVKPEGTVLAADTSLLQFNLNVGTIYQIDRSLGLEVQCGFGLGIPISAVPATTTTREVELGLSYFF